MIGFAAGLYAVLALLAALFQLALVFGAPWGALALGGRWQERLPPLVRIFALGQAAMILGMAWVVCARAGVAVPPAGPGWLFWPVLVLTALSMVANLTTPSRPERRLWGPVSVAMLLAALVVVFAD